MSLRNIFIVLLAVFVLAAGSMTAFAAVNNNAAPTNAQCTGQPVLTQDNQAREQNFSIDCSVPFPDQETVTQTVPGPTQTVTVTPTPTQPTTPTSPPTSTPPPSNTDILWGSSVAGTSNNGSAVQTKFGHSKVYVRQFVPESQGTNLPWPTSVPNGVLLHRSYKPSLNVTNAQIDALLLKAEGHWVTFWHEPDNDGLSASERADRIALMNRLYDRNVALGRPATIVPTFTGGMFADYRDEAYKQQWSTVKGDLIGVDLDGVSNCASAYGTEYDDEIDETMDWLDQNTEYTGWAAPEFGTCRHSSDPTGVGRRSWMQEQVGFMEDVAVQPEAVAWYDYNSTPNNSVEPGTPEYVYWKSLIDTN